jgi:hypothetical protein
MRKIAMSAVAVVATSTAPAAYALNFDFSFTGGSGGIVTGELIGLAASGQSQPTDIIITSSPFPLVTPYDIFSAPIGGVNGGFSVHSGQITHAAYTISNRNGSQIGFSLVLGSNGWHALSQFTTRNATGGHPPSQFSLSPGNVITLPAVGLAPEYVNTAAASNGPTATPEPASIALLGAGLTGIAAFRRRRRAAR